MSNAKAVRKKVVILGSTGSIGTSALKVAKAIPDRMEVIALAANRQADLLLEQAREWNPQAIALFDEDGFADLKKNAPRDTKCYAGAEGLIKLATLSEADIILVAIVGTAGLAPALAALRAGKDLAVASKEILVMAGEAVMAEAHKHGCKILPVDSEHNAIFQCLASENGETKQIKRLIITASGGPFRQSTVEEIASATPEQALKHPTWNMGRKITIDSATLFNKGLEMIEARWLFEVPMAQVEVVVHPQSIVHSLVEFIDGSQLAQLSHSDMCFPIQYAVTYPDRLPNNLKPLNLAAVGALTFEAPDEKRFPALGLAREAGEKGGTLPAVLNAANEMAVPAFLERKIPFPRIWQLVEEVMRAHEVVTHPTLEKIIAADTWARAKAADLLPKGKAVLV